METIAQTSSRAFLREHPVITQRVLLHSTGKEETLLAGSVIGTTSEVKGEAPEGGEAPVVMEAGKHLLFGASSDMTPVGILHGDVTVPATGDAWGVCYVHCAALAEELIWADGISAETQATAIAALRGLGVYVE
ncbi:hypothetical protein HMPREF0326_01531 [Desulfovibrio sp. 3_1_syn3]|uniref:hypothetical protein n=1 Tax=Desulfovibrio sp. 3_1_syn3 TaxID=457398 RepID=UPI0001E12A7C|nr:hypothetical protein [Desulfovibrio sp. 3_1_syn3]EFL85828.1 hypothetical protein HMPREF0326_01531 [Desulfovibrio sp. 3_1_syn3]